MEALPSHCKNCMHASSRRQIDGMRVSYRRQSERLNAERPTNDVKIELLSDEAVHFVRVDRSHARNEKKEAATLIARCVAFDEPNQMNAVHNKPTDDYAIFVYCSVDEQSASRIPTSNPTLE